MFPKCGWHFIIYHHDKGPIELLIADILTVAEINNLNEIQLKLSYDKQVGIELINSTLMPPELE